MLFPLDMVDFTLMLIGASVPLYAALKIKGNLQYRLLLLLLGGFALSHGFWHLARSFQSNYLANVFINPLAAILLVAFAILYYREGL